MVEICLSDEGAAGSNVRVAAVCLRVDDDFADSDATGAFVIAVVVDDQVANVTNSVVAVFFFEQGGLSLVVDAVSGCELDEGGDDCDEVHVFEVVV